jgi:Leucine-rich repeat (LRR) protein
LYNSLTGLIPKELFVLWNLTKLLLLSNELLGIVPPDIGNCTNNQPLLTLAQRQLAAGMIPAEIGNLKNLNFLDMSGNHLIGLVPAAIARCGSLQFLGLHSNALSDALPDVLPRSIQVVDVSDNQLSGQLRSSLSSMPELTKALLEQEPAGRCHPTRAGLL